MSDMDLIECERFPVKMWVRNGGDEFVVNEVIEADTYGLADMPVQTGVVLDIGGNIGAFAVLAEYLWPRATVLSFEPVRSNCELIVKNRELNWPACDREAHGAPPLEDRTICTAVWEHDRGVLMGGAGGLAHVASLGTSTPPDDQESASSITFDQIAGLFTRLDLVKIDTEGAEVKALLAASPESMGKIARIIGEFHGIDLADDEWGRWVRHLTAFLPVTFRAHDWPNQGSGGMFYGTRET